MQFSLPCAAFARLSAVCEWMPDNWPQPYLRALYVERKNHKLIAVATNNKMAVIELLHASNAGPDEHCFIAFDPVLIAQCRVEAQFSSSVEFVVTRELSWTAAATQFGYVHSSNVGIFPTDDKIETVNWRNWMPDELPKDAYGQMQVDCSLMRALVEASPSKHVVFPQFIDIRQPVIMRDKIDPNWIGLFMVWFDEKAPKLRIPTW